MNDLRSAEQEAAEDIFFGQVVMIWARWFVIAGAAIVTLLQATEISDLTSATAFVVGLMAINFFVHGRYLMELPANRSMLLALSLLDLLIITSIVVSGVGGGERGLASPYFIFYYPVVLAVAFVFQPRMSAALIILTLAAYGIASSSVDSGLINNSVLLERLVARMISLGATGGLAAFYWRIQRDRRRTATS